MFDDGLDDGQPEGPTFPVVGIGASAGGLEAFTELLHGLPSEPGCAILFASHLEPHHKSHLADILRNVTGLPVNEVHEGMEIQVNQIYLIPPNTNMALAEGKLHLTPRSPLPGQHMPIDHLFRSLAGIQKSRAIGVVLSGGGTDGTLGFQAIKAEAGITLAQEESSAVQASMPRSAILDGSVDYVLTPREIGRQLVRLIQHPYAKSPAPAATVRSPDALAEILELLRGQMQVDFTHYKKSTVARRIQRRLALRDCHDVDDYLELLHHDREELSNLYQDLLIRVTQFFRDREAFEIIKDKVFPALLHGRTAARPIRIWVAGCSTGEEVYSLAMALTEFMDNWPERVPIKILATDLNENALQKARNGLYVDNIEADVAPERLRRFFNRVDGYYQISKNIRELCVFSRHDLTSDPPFSHLDLVSCRNVLIYMDSSLQRRVLPILHYALQPDGYLFLGPSENVGPFTELFAPLDGKHRIFVKQAASGAHGHALELGSIMPGEARPLRVGHKATGPLWSALDVQREADRIVLSRYAPVGVVVDEALTVVQFRGRTAPFLEPAPGIASLDLFRMLSEGLMAEVRAAVTQARSENVIAAREGLRFEGGVPVQPVRVEVIPFQAPPSGGRFFLVMFTDLEKAEEAAPRPPAEPHPSADLQVGQLQQELSAMRDYLQSVIEERENTNEELKSANEEILSANEELQSTNEELQTAKEEAQSANEELATVNEELRHRNVELARLNNDLVNLLGGVDIPILMVNRELRIRRFTPAAEKLFRLIPTDIGRPIRDIKTDLDVPNLDGLISQVIDTLAPYESYVRDAAGRAYRMRVRPYVTLDKTIDGASVVLLDLDVLGRMGDLPRMAPDAAQNAGS